MAFRWCVLFVVSLSLVVSINALPKGFVKLEKEHNILAWKDEGWIMNERVEPHQTLKLTFALKQRNLDALEKLFWRVSDPDSKGYGKHLSLHEVASLVAPSQTTQMTVKSWLRENRVELKKCISVKTEDFLTCDMPCEVAEFLLPGAKFYYFNHRSSPNHPLDLYNTILYQKNWCSTLILWEVS
ncbi:hypothetical protein QZH41_007643 [Actinostola sp. cb2023]|nr:hypothetical protein QZH41_007643 [Actinostola sp. cb2023]